MQLKKLFFSQDNDSPDIATIETNFKDVKTTTPIAVYWYWLNDNLSEEGVIKDLDAMKEAGIGRAYIGFQGVENIPQGNVKFRRVVESASHNTETRIRTWYRNRYIQLSGLEPVWRPVGKTRTVNETYCHNIDCS